VQEKKTGKLNFLLTQKRIRKTNKNRLKKMALDFAATYKVLLLGDSNVGKTCIVHRYCDERYYDTYISTIGELCFLFEFFFKFIYLQGGRY
jgi:GTPase SAR1 family protein